MLKALSKTKAMRVSESTIINPINWETIKIPMLIFIMTVAYIVIFQFTNFFVSSSIFLITLMKFYKVKSWKVIILTTIIFNVIIYVGFVRFLNVPLI
jgi:hypothetical protein